MPEGTSSFFLTFLSLAYISLLKAPSRHEPQKLKLYNFGDSA